MSENLASTETKESSAPVITNGDLSTLLTALSKIGELDIEDFKLNYSISKNLTNLLQFQRAFGKSMMALVKKYVTHDDGGPMSDPANNYIFKDAATKKLYLDELQALNDQPIPTDLKLYPLLLSKLKEIKGIKATSLAQISAIVIADVEV